MAVKIERKEIGTEELLNQISFCLAPDSFVDTAACLISNLAKKRSVEATVEEVVEAVNLGIEKGALKVNVVAKKDDDWMIMVGVRSETQS